MDFVEETPKLSLSDTENQIEEEETLELALKLFGDIAVEIENGADIKLQHPSEFYYATSQEVIALKDRINELEIMLEGAKKGVDRYVYGQLEIVGEDGEIIAVLDEWVSRQLIEGAITTYVTKALVKGVVNLEDN